MSMEAEGKRGDNAFGEFQHLFYRGTSSRIFLLLHGTGGNEKDLIPIAKYLDPSASSLSPRGKVLENGMPRFFRRVSEGIFDIEDLKFRTDELAEFVLRAASRYGFDLQQLVAVGFSNGANIASALLLQRPELISMAILFRPMMVPLQPSPSFELRKRIFISSGEFDAIVPTQSVKELADLFEKAGADVKANWVRSSHGLTEEDLSAAKTWLESWN